MKLSTRQLYVLDRALVHEYNAKLRNARRRKNPDSATAMELTSLQELSRMVKAELQERKKEDQ